MTILDRGRHFSARWLGLTGMLLALLAQAPTHAETRAVVIGVSSYKAQPYLPGAAADAADIRDAFAARGIADVAFLVNADATQERVDGAVRRAIAKSEPGDILLLTFAGHGTLFVENAANKQKKAFLLHGYSERETPAQRLIEDDLRAWARDLETKRAILVAVLDACHSGVGLRGNTLNFPLTPERFVANASANLADAAPPDRIVASNAYVFGATDTARSVHEVIIDGAERGALSFAFARAIEGATDPFNTERTTAGSMRAFLSQVVRNVSQNDQVLQFHIPDDRQVILQPTRPPSPKRFVEKPVTLTVSPASGAAPSLDPNRVKLEPSGLADLIWNPIGSRLHNIYGDTVARDIGAKEVATAADAYWVYRQLVAKVLEGPRLQTSMDPNGTLLCGTQRISLIVSDTPLRYVAVFDLSANGLVQYGDVGEFDVVPWRKSPDGFKWQVVIGEPFGADYMIVIASDRPMTQLAEQVRLLDDTKRPLDFYRAVMDALEGRQYAIAVHERYSGDEKEFPDQCRSSATSEKRP